MRISDWSSDVCSSDLRPSPNPSGKREGDLSTPPRDRRLFEPGLRNALAHPRAEMPEAYRLVAQGSHREASRRHPLLDARYECCVLDIDLPLHALVAIVGRSPHTPRPEADTANYQA